MQIKESLNAGLRTHYTDGEGSKAIGYLTNMKDAQHKQGIKPKDNTGAYWGFMLETISKIAAKKG